MLCLSGIFFLIIIGVIIDVIMKIYFFDIFWFVKEFDLRCVLNEIISVGCFFS